MNRIKRLAILTAGGDTPALNATLDGAVTRANQLQIEILGVIKGFSGLLNPRIPHVVLNPLFTTIPELDPTRGGTILGASRDYVDANDRTTIKSIADRLQQHQVDGLICIGGDGTLNGMQAIGELLPTALAPKTIDNDLGLNYRNEPDEWLLDVSADGKKSYHRTPAARAFDLSQMINYVTPGFATAVYVSASGVERIRTTAESHRRIAIVEVMGRHSGYIALGSSYGQPDILLIPENPLNLPHLIERIKELYERQKHVVLVCGEGIVDEQGNDLGAERASSDPAGNKLLSGAAESLRRLLIENIGDDYFRSKRRNESASAAIFTRKIGHTQRGGRPIRFDRFYANLLGGKAVDLIVEGRNNFVSVLQYDPTNGFYVDGVPANDFRDRWGHIHARKVHLDCYDAQYLRASRTGVDYLRPIFDNALGQDDLQAMHHIFSPGHVGLPFHSVHVDVSKRIRFLEPNS